MEREQAALPVPLHERRAEAEVIVEPRAQPRRESGGRGPRRLESRKRRELAVLRAPIGAVAAGEIRRERQRDDDDEQRREHHLHQNRK